MKGEVDDYCQDVQACSGVESYYTSVQVKKLREDQRCEAASLNEYSVRTHGARCPWESRMGVAGKRLCFAHGTAVKRRVRTLEDVLNGKGVEK